MAAGFPLATIALTMLAGAGSAGPVSLPIKVEVVPTEGGYRLLRGGQPYDVKGAGMAVADLARFAAYGGNSIRNWTTADDPQDIRALLDAAHAHGVTVALCLPMRPERHGFDYDDPDAVAHQLETLREDVLRFRDHPALLVWIVGNELNHSATNARVYDAVDDVAKMVHELDPYHPVTTAVAGFDADRVAEILARAPNLDFLSFQLYGRLFSLRERMQAARFDRPFMVTEWGATGWWESETTSWAAPVEMTSSEKADRFLRAHREVLATFGSQLIGSYVFMWGQKQERTPTWFGLLLDGGEGTEAADVMQFIWTGRWPADRSPRVDSLRLDGRVARESVTLSAGETYEAAFEVSDPEGEALRFRWEVKPESEATQVGGDREEPIASLEGVLSNPTAPVTSISVPRPGKYRLFAYAYDPGGRAAHANIPFLVEPGDER